MRKLRQYIISHNTYDCAILIRYDVFGTYKAIFVNSKGLIGHAQTMKQLTSYYAQNTLQDQQMNFGFMMHNFIA